MYDLGDDGLDISRVHRRVTLHRNGRLDGAKQLQLRPEWTLDDLLCAAEARMGLGATPK
jgi:hypothetical protein